MRGSLGLSMQECGAGPTDPEAGLAPTLEQVVLGAKQLFEADGAGLMLIDRRGRLRWASASDQTAQTLEDGQECLAQGPCMVAFSQRAPAAIRDISHEPQWGELGRVLAGEGIGAAMVMGREGLDAQAAFERLRRAARCSSRRLVDVARKVPAGKPLPPANRSQRRPRSLGQAGQQDTQPGSDS